MPPETTGRQIGFPEYEEYTELLRDAGGPFRFVSRQKHFPTGSVVGQPPQTRSLHEIEKSVMESPRVKNVITEEAIRRKCDEEQVRKEALEILREMAHQYSLINIRGFGYVVCTLMEKLFDGIYVNHKMISEIRERSKKDCVIFMPSHKTYFDFLLLSLICFLYDVQLPAIAAGMDFMSMKFVGEILRRSGAFFMRRSFGSDQLYWAVFSEYVQTHVVHNDRPIEFFVEATRSRVGKSLHPKYGMLQIVLEPYLRGSVFDLVIVPVSMSYDKILEEKLYAYELLGFPKPRESTSGLLKAREVLDRKNGNCFITFGEPISVRDYFGMSLHRSSFVCQPDSQFVLKHQAKIAIRKLAHHVVHIHNQNAVITIWHLASMVILQTLDEDDSSEMSYHEMYLKLSALCQLLKRLGVIVNIQKDLDFDLRYYLTLHNELFEPFDISERDFCLRLVSFPVAFEKLGVPREIMERAISRLILTTYSNGMIHCVVSEGIICRILEFENDFEKIEEEFCWLTELMKREFVTVPGDAKMVFRRSLKILKSSRIIDQISDNLRIIELRAAKELSKLILPYFRNFENVLHYFHPSRPIIENLNEIIPAVQRKIINSYQLNPSSVRLSFLSTEPIKNTFSALLELSVLVKTDNGISINFSHLGTIQKRLHNFTKNASLSKI